jgi:hypothetical protein
MSHDGSTVRTGVERRAGTCSADPMLDLGTTLGFAEGVAVVVIREPRTHGVLRCGDRVLKPQRPPACGAARVEPGSIRAGDRFNDPVSGLQLICTRPGDGVLNFSDRPLLKARPHASVLMQAARRTSRQR